MAVNCYRTQPQLSPDNPNICSQALYATCEDPLSLKQKDTLKTTAKNYSVTWW